MNSKEFKTLFNEVAQAYGFEKQFGSWFIESPECIGVLELQKSNFGDYYELNIKIFIQGVFRKEYKKNKELAKRDMGDIFLRQPEGYREVFDFDIPMDDIKRKKRLEELFQNYISPLYKKVMTREGIIAMHKNEGFFLLPAIKEQLGIS